MATRLLDLPFAVAIVTEDLPAIYDQNLMLVEEPVPAAVLLRSIDQVAHTVGWRHRRIEIADHRIAEGLRGALLAAGYTEERFLTMVLDGPAVTPEADRLATAIVAIADQLDLARALHGQEPWASTAAIVDQFIRRERRLAELARGRAVVGPPDEPVSRCLLLAHGSMIEIDAVSTLEAYRGRGWSRAVVRHAVAAARDAGAEHVMLVADADDWPMHWYERLGFGVVGTASAFRRQPEEA